MQIGNESSRVGKQTTWQFDIRVGVEDTFLEFFMGEYEYSSKYEYLGLLISRHRSVVVATNHVTMGYGRYHCSVFNLFGKHVPISQFAHLAFCASVKNHVKQA